MSICFTSYSNVFIKYITNKKNLITATATASAIDLCEEKSYEKAFVHAKNIAINNAVKIAFSNDEKLTKQLEVKELNKYTEINICDEKLENNDTNLENLTINTNNSDKSSVLIECNIPNENNSNNHHNAIANVYAEFKTNYNTIITGTATATATANTQKEAYDLAFDLAKSIVFSNAKNEAELSNQIIETVLIVIPKNDMSNLSDEKEEDTGKF